MTVWVLNLDAEDELRALPGNYAPSDTMRARIREHATALRGLLRDGDLTIDGAPAAPDHAAALRGQRGDAWCPTPRALALLRDAGVTPPAAPAAEVLRAVNDRRFAQALGTGPLGTHHFEDVEAIAEHVARRQAPRGYLLKRGLGFAGRGQRRIGSTLTEADRAFCVATLRRGEGLTVEPHVERLADFAQHGYLRREGTLLLGRTTAQQCDARGAWHGSAPAAEDALEGRERTELLETGKRVAAALHSAGYFGPFGIDAFRYRDDAGQIRFNPLVEINARYTMGYGASGLPTGVQAMDGSDTA